MTRKLTTAAEDAIAEALDARRNLSLKRLLKRFKVRNKATLYRAARRAKERLMMMAEA